MKKCILDIFQEYFATEEQRADALEGREKEDVDLSKDISILTGTAKIATNDEYGHFTTKLISGRLSSLLGIISRR
jgi:hypothetical protein